jgi:hypothetical protein
MILGSESHRTRRHTLLSDGSERLQTSLVSEKSIFEFMKTRLYFELVPGLKSDLFDYLSIFGNFSMYSINCFTYFVVIKYYSLSCSGDVNFVGSV